MTSLPLIIAALLLLLAASTPPPVQGQMPPIPIPFLNTITGILSGLNGSLLTPINTIPIVTPIITSLLPVTLNVTGILTCPGQLGTGIGGLPVNLTCLTNGGRQLLTGQSVTNANGAFAVNATLSPAAAIGFITTVLPNNTIPCLVSAPLGLVRSVLTCPAITGAATSVVSIVQMVGPSVFSVFGRVLNGNAGASVAV